MPKTKSPVNLLDKEVNVKLSICGKCNGIVRVAVEHMMDKKIKNEFLKEVMEHNLTVKQQPLLEYRKNKQAWCKCK
jgi:hypothetical protein